MKASVFGRVGPARFSRRFWGAGMNGGGGQQDPGGDKAVNPEEAALKAQLRRLGSRVEQLQAAREEAKPSRRSGNGDTAGLARAFRLSTEFIAGIVAGGMLGYGIDRWFGTAPWGMIVCFMLGFGAGLTNVMRAAGMFPQRVENRGPVSGQSGSGSPRQDKQGGDG
jgi:ATP synthase protein I